VIGFPSCGDAPAALDAVSATLSWIADGSRPVVLATLGSFLGITQIQVWDSVIRATKALGIRAVLVGPRAPRLEADTGFDREQVKAVGIAPLAQLMPGVDAVIHHRGIGTMFTQIRSCRPAVVIPQGYDQPWNARLLEDLGVGLDGRAVGIGQGLETPSPTAGTPSGLARLPHV
jgi:UDP:flavonoid glycosyltransferase YjiC (YdhE family)